ncbi:hypothetical protein ACFLTK_01745 [Chloroflexota bacterium]
MRGSTGPVSRRGACGVRPDLREVYLEAAGIIQVPRLSTLALHYRLVPSGELLYALAGWVARMESQRRSERNRAGLARVKAQGKQLGRPPGSTDMRKRRKRQRLIAL